MNNIEQNDKLKVHHLEHNYKMVKTSLVAATCLCLISLGAIVILASTSSGKYGLNSGDTKQMYITALAVYTVCFIVAVGGMIKLRTDIGKVKKSASLTAKGR